jgi:hypothetical protein
MSPNKITLPAAIRFTMAIPMAACTEQSDHRLVVIDIKLHNLFVLIVFCCKGTTMISYY